MAKHLADKIKGMLLLSAYGDALGAFHELSALSEQGKVIDPKKNASLKWGKDFPPTRFENPWAIWMSQKVLANKQGITTDDTAFRWALLYPWMLCASLKPQPIDSEYFNSFFYHTPKPSFSCSHLENSRQLQFIAWQEMHHASQHKLSAHFYSPTSPMAFGLFQCLDLAILFGEKSPKKVFQTFKALNPLDQDYGKLITGIFAVLMAKGLQNKNQQLPESVLFGELIEDTLTELTHCLVLDWEKATWEKILYYHQKAVSFANQNFQNDIAFLEAFRQEIFLNPTFPHFNWEGNGRNNHDPLLFWMQIIATLHYAKFNIIRTMQLLASGAGDTDTLATITGLLLGLWSGANYLYSLEDDSIKLKEELNLVENTLTFMFEIDVNTQTKELVKLVTSTHDV